MSASDAKTRIDEAFARRWSSIPLFWRFQSLGWLAFMVASFPLKLVVLDSWETAFVVSVYREGVGFITTWGMREVYRRVYRPVMGWFQFSGLIILVSLLGAAVQSVLVLGLHDVIDYEEEKLFQGEVVFAVLYFRGGICFAWSFLYFGIKLWRENTAREIQLLKVKSEKKDAELQMLRAQMNPHFLFNALTTIRAGIGNTAIDLKSIVEGLADFLRFSLDHRGEDLVALEKEFEAMKGYLAVEKARFREDLEFKCHLDNGAGEAMVPGICLQPLVENAIKYGRKTSPRPLRLVVRADKFSDSTIRVVVSNTGSWVEPSSDRKSGGLGLPNLRRRLDLLYPKKTSLEISAEKGWVTISMNIPFIHGPIGSSSRHR